MNYRRALIELIINFQGRYMNYNVRNAMRYVVAWGIAKDADVKAIGELVDAIIDYQVKNGITDIHRIGYCTDYLVRQDAFMKFMKEEFNPEQERTRQRVINEKDAATCFKIIHEFNKQWGKIDQSK